MERDSIPQPYLQILTDFNSHAHVERDRDACMVCNANPNFNSHAHVERDNHTKGCSGKRSYFNSHAHVERDV